MVPPVRFKRDDARIGKNQLPPFTRRQDFSNDRHARANLTREVLRKRVRLCRGCSEEQLIVFAAVQRKVPLLQIITSIIEFRCLFFTS